MCSFRGGTGNRDGMSDYTRASREESTRPRPKPRLHCSAEGFQARILRSCRPFHERIEPGANQRHRVRPHTTGGTASPPRLR